MGDEILTPEALADWVGRTMADAVDADACAAVSSAVNAHLGTRLTFTGPVPADVSLAGLLLGSRWYSRRNSPDGLVGFGDMGGASIRNLDPDIRDLLKPYLRRAVG